MEWVTASQWVSTARDMPVQTHQPAFPFGLGVRGVHEIIAQDYADAAAATGFALYGARQAGKGAILWVRQKDEIRQHGGVYGHGALALGIDPGRILIVSPRKKIDTLWTIEEGLRSGAVGLVLGDVTDIDFTATRRLALASAAHGVPAIIRLPYGHEGATAATARWRVKTTPSGHNVLDVKAPGNARLVARLERARHAPQQIGRSFHLEVDDETLSLRMVPQLGAGTPYTRQQPFEVPDKPITRQAAR